MLGHKSLRTTERYAKIVDRNTSEDMKALKIRLSEIDAALEAKKKKNLNKDLLIIVALRSF